MSSGPFSHDNDKHRICHQSKINRCLKTATIAIKPPNAFSSIRRYIPSKRIFKTTLIRMAKENLRSISENMSTRRWTLFFFMVLAGTYVFTSTFLVACMKKISHATEMNQIFAARIENVYKFVNISQRNSSQRETNYTRIKLISEYHMKGFHLRKAFNCSLLFDGDIQEGNKVTNYLTKHEGERNLTLIPEEQAIKMFRKCDVFKSIRGYSQMARTEEEKNFPLAYVILLHEGFEQMERLIRALYQPQNVFCIHVDLKSPASLHQAVKAYASCFPNIRVASVQHNITYAHVTRLLADITCMTDLSKLNHPWRYLITGVSTEFPLRSNKEKVDIFTALNGSNHIREAWTIRIPDRYQKQYEAVDGKMRKTGLPKQAAPHNITVVKGMASNGFSRAFVDWFYKDKMALDLLEWSRDTYSPDEHYWGTLNNLYHNPFLKTPGGYKGHPDSKHYQCTFANWVSPSPNHTTPCYGRIQHNLCYFGSMDLPIIKNQMSINANKFDLTHDPVAYACMEELLEDREKHPQPVKIAIYVDPILSRTKRSTWNKKKYYSQAVNKRKAP